MPIITNMTLSNAVNLIRRDKSVVEAPLSHAAFTLDSSGVAGFFGGESAVRAMATVNLLPKRRWCGWYNAPGSYEVAKQYSPLAMSDIFDGLFPGSSRDPAKILMVDGQSGSKYISVHSPTADPSHIGHLGYLLERKARQMPIKKAFPRTKGGRHTMDVRVTLVRLNHMPDEFDPLSLIPSLSITFSLGTVLISLGGCVACALIADWFCFVSIALGIIANGIAYSVIGSGKLILKHNIPAQVESPGDVVLKGDTEIVVLVGSEGAVSPLTRARFVLQYYGKPEFQPEQDKREEDPKGEGEDEGAPGGMPCERCNRPLFPCKGCCQPAGNDSRTRWPRIEQKYLVRASVMLLLSQFLAQLLLIPQGTLFGQLMFIATLLPSWIYHSYLSSLSLDFQTQTLFKKLRVEEGEDIHRYQLNTWTEAVVFTCLALTSVRHKSHPNAEAEEKLQNNIQQLLDGLLPSKTDVWQVWKKSLVEKVLDCANLEHERRSLPSKLYSGDGGEEGGNQTGTGDKKTTTTTTTTKGGKTTTTTTTTTESGKAMTSTDSRRTTDRGMATMDGEKRRRDGDQRKTLRDAEWKQLWIYQEDANRALEAWKTVRDSKEIRSLRYTARDGDYY